MNTFNPVDSSDIIIDGALLIYGTYSKQGDDLKIHTDLESVLIKDFFVHTPNLVSVKGSKITPHLATLLSAPNHQSEFLGFEDPQAIGEITLTGGPITVTRAGQKIELNVGDYIYLNDLVEVGEYNVGITFKDDTALSLESGARMVIDDFVYDPDTPTEGSMNANVLGGGFSFVSGNVAKTGADAMTVTTPVLTIGVRGTQVAGRANQDGEDNEIILLPNDDGTVGQIMVSNDSGSVLLTEAFQGTTITSAVEAPSIPVIIPEDVVLKKFAKTIATNKTTLKTSKKNKQSKEAEKEKQKLEKEKEDLEQEKEQLEEEAEQLEEEKAELEEKLADEEITEEEKAELEEELAAVEEKVVAVEEKVEQVVEQAEQVEQKFEKVEQQIQEIEQEFEQFFEDIKEEFGEEVVADVEQAVAEAEKVFEEKIQEEVAKEVEAEIKEEEKIEDPFEEAPQEEMEKEMEQKMEEEIQLLDEEPPVEEMPVEEDIFEEKMEEEVNKIEEEFAPENFEEEPILMEDNVFADEQKDEPKIEEEKIEEVKVEDFNQPMMNDEVFPEVEFVPFFEPDANNENEEPNDFNFQPIINLDNIVEEDIEVIEAVEADPVVLNSAPTIDSISNVSKSESLSVGSTIATASASDADGDTLTYSLTTDQSSKLTIDNNGVITLASAFDDVATDTNYNVTVRAFDGTDDAKTNFVLTVTADGSITIHENILDFEDVHSDNDGTPIAYKQNVGYYTMDLYQGDTHHQKRIVENTGHTATNLTDVRTADLQNIDIMYVHNGDNSRYLPEWLTGVGMANSSTTSSASSDVWSWVNDGGILLIQDRHVTNANNMLLGESATITRSVSIGTNNDTDFRTELNDTLLYNGAAGTLTNNTLDGGSHTDHGYITNLGTGEVGIGHKGTGDSPNGESYNNAFAYKYGSGLVYYDTYPMDLWDAYGYNSTYSASSTLTTGGAQTYNENLIQWAASLYYDGASQINGTSNADKILGTMGDDVIYGGGGADTLWGGEGADVFKYEAMSDTNASANYDSILDFNASDDSIDISDITNGASVTKVWSGGVLNLDIDSNSTIDMYIGLTGFTGTVDDITVVT